jgi:hypothetical protein
MVNLLQFLSLPFVYCFSSELRVEGWYDLVFKDARRTLIGILKQSTMVQKRKYFKLPTIENKKKIKI